MQEQKSRFLGHIKNEKNYSENTVVNYSRDLDQFSVFLKDRELLSVTNLTIREYVVSMNAKKYSKATLERKIAVLKSFFKYLKREDVLKINPAENISFPKKEKKLPRFLEEKEALASLLAGKGDFKNIEKIVKDGFINEMLMYEVAAPKALQILPLLPRDSFLKVVEYVGRYH